MTGSHPPFCTCTGPDWTGLLQEAVRRPGGFCQSSYYVHEPRTRKVGAGPVPAAQPAQGGRLLTVSGWQVTKTHTDTLYEPDLAKIKVRACGPS